MKKDVFDFLDVFNSETILKDPMFIQALKDFEKMGFIKIHEDKIEICNYKALENYLNNFGKFESNTKH